MKTEKREIGDRGEAAAAKYLRKIKCKVLAKNAFFGKKEVDIIAEDREHIIFAEVKTRTRSEDGALPYGRPILAVNREKQQNLIAAARMYLAAHPSNKRLRFDVLEVYLSEGDPKAPPTVVHIPDAFRA